MSTTSFAALQRPGVPQAWRLPIALEALLLLALVALFLPTAMAMVDIWQRNGDHTHAFVVPPITLWLVWRLRAELLPLAPRPAPWVVLPMAVLALAWWFGNLAAIGTVTQYAFVGLLVATVPLMFGLRVTWVLLFPLAFAFFAVPTGESVTPYLMRWTAQMVVTFLRLSGVPVFQEGQQLVIPSGRWAVIEACGGIRYLMSTLMVGALFAYLNYRSAKRRLIFMGLSILVPIIANWLRAYMVVMIGHLSDNRYATGVDHILYGWVFFGIVIFALFMIGARWTEDWSDATPGSPTVAAAVDRPGAATVVSVCCAAAALVAAGWPQWLEHARERARPAAASRARPALALPDRLARDWVAVADNAPPTFSPDYTGADLDVRRTYAGTAGEVTLNLLYYRDQTYDRKLIASPNVLIVTNHRRWNRLGFSHPVTEQPRPLEWEGGFMVQNDLGDIAAGSRPAMVAWQIYWVGGHLTARPIEGRLWQAWLGARGEPDDASAIVLWTTAAKAEEGDARLKAFVADNLDRVLDALAKARAAR